VGESTAIVSIISAAAAALVTAGGFWMKYRKQSGDYGFRQHRAFEKRQDELNSQQDERMKQILNRSDQQEERIKALTAELVEAIRRAERSETENTFLKMKSND
jgi:hypothetical protein